LKIPGFWDDETWGKIDHGRSYNWETEKLFKEIAEKHASQNEPESAATVVRDCP
jgi:hypothetical protein